jgi:hypothetical protein
MKKLMGLLLMLPLLGSEPAGYKYWSAADLKGLARTLSEKLDAKTSLEGLGTFGRDRAVMVHRNRSGVAEEHETDADLMVMVAGGGELIVGGTMRKPKKTAPGELRGPGIEGGVRHKLAPGDIVHIPPKTPHQMLLDPGTEISYFVLKAKE